MEDSVRDARRPARRRHRACDVSRRDRAPAVHGSGRGQLFSGLYRWSVFQCGLSEDVSVTAAFVAIPDKKGKRGPREMAQQAPASTCRDLSLAWDTHGGRREPDGKRGPFKGSFVVNSISSKRCFKIYWTLKWINYSIVRTMKYSAIEGFPYLCRFASKNVCVKGYAVKADS